MAGRWLLLRYALNPAPTLRRLKIKVSAARFCSVPIQMVMHARFPTSPFGCMFFHLWMHMVISDVCSAKVIRSPEKVPELTDS